MSRIQTSYMTDEEFARFVDHHVWAEPTGLPVEWQRELVLRYQSLLKEKPSSEPNPRQAHFNFND
jgi:hypothetical protein